MAGISGVKVRIFISASDLEQFLSTTANTFISLTTNSDCTRFVLVYT
jgi:hypothetical protein